MKRHILSLDQGTSSSRAILFDEDLNIVSVAQREFTQHFPRPGWVEHNPEDIWESQREVMMQVLSEARDRFPDAVGIANQRETTVVWDAVTGRSVYNAIVWQDRRTAEFCDSLKARGLEETVRSKTGLPIDAYFSAGKIRWILENVPGAREKAERGQLRFGTVDSWLLWKLTGGRVHATDVSNASRTMLFNIHTLDWDPELLELFDIPASMLPRVRSSSENYAYVDWEACLPGEGALATAPGRDAAPAAGATSASDAVPASDAPSAGGSYGIGEALALPPLPVCALAGDQQAALFGQMCLDRGSVKNTYGTGCFLLMNTGPRPIASRNRLITTVAWKIGDRVDYALEGSIFVAGSVVQWLRDGLGIIRSSSEIEALASSVQDNGGVYFVPALTGLGAPYWNQQARGLITGISRGTTAGHIARAALEAIAFETMDIVRAMEKDAGVRLTELKVDGGASRNDLLMQFQADILGTEVIRPTVTETTALGAACLAGLAVGIWASPEQLRGRWQAGRRFSSAIDDTAASALAAAWADAVRRCLCGWSGNT